MGMSNSPKHGNFDKLSTNVFTNNHHTDRRKPKPKPEKIRHTKQVMFKSQTQELKLKKKKDEAIKANETHEAVIINGEDVLLLRQQESETATSRVFEGDAVCLGAKNAVDVVAVIEFIIKPFRNLDNLRRITVLHYYQMITLEEGPPHLKATLRKQNQSGIPPSSHRRSPSINTSTTHWVKFCYQRLGQKLESRERNRELTKIKKC